MMIPPRPATTARLSTISLPCFLALVGLGLGAIACTPPDKQGALEAPDADLSSRFRTTESRLGDDEQEIVVAKVNKEEFTLGEVERRLNSQSPFVRRRYKTVERKREFLDNMVQFELLADEAERRGYADHPEVVLGLKQAMVRRMIEDRVSEGVRLSDVTDREVERYYENHKKDYIRPEKLRASLLVVESEEAALAVEKELRAAFAERPNKTRRIFGAKAREVSIDTETSAGGGDLRFFARAEDGDDIDPRISKVAFSLNTVGAMSRPFPLDEGWALLVVTAKRARVEKSFEEVRDAIRQLLYRQKRDKLQRDIIEELKAQAEVSIDEEALGKLPDPVVSEDHHPAHEGSSDDQGEDKPDNDDGTLEQDEPAEDRAPEDEQ